MQGILANEHLPSSLQYTTTVINSQSTDHAASEVWYTSFISANSYSHTTK